MKTRDIAAAAQTIIDEYGSETFEAFIDRLTTLVNDVLDLSALQSGNVGIVMGNVNFSDMLLKIISRFEPLSHREGYHIILIFLGRVDKNLRKAV